MTPRWRPGVRALVVWTLAAIASSSLLPGLERSLRSRVDVRGSESADVERRLREDFDTPVERVVLLVITRLPGAADIDSTRALVRTIVAPLHAHPGVVAVISPASSLDTLLLSWDRTTAVAVVGLTSGDAGSIAALRDLTRRSLSGRVPGVTLRWTGEPVVVEDLRVGGAREARVAELRALPLTALVAVWAFGSIARAGLALVAATLAIVITLGLTSLASGLVPPTLFVRTIVPLAGLALTIDYTLYLLRRRAEGEDERESRRTVGLAGVLVAIGFAGLAIAPTGELRTAAISGIVTSLLAALAAITLAPLASSGFRHEKAVASARWRAWGAFVVRRPLAVLAATALPLALLAWQASTARLSTSLDNWLPEGVESGEAFEDLARADRGALPWTLRLLVELPPGHGILTPPGWQALRLTSDRLAQMDGVGAVRSIATIGTGELVVAQHVLPAAVRQAYVSRDGRTAAFDVVPSSSAGSAALTLVGAIRSLDAAGLTGVPGSRILTTGLSAIALDYQRLLRAALPWIVVATAAATFLALLIAFRAPLAALKAVALNLLVSAAAIGATVLVFQDGIGASVLGHRTLGSIFPTVPVIAFAATFGMSMDYELFLLTSVRQRRLAGAPENEAVVEGLAATGALVTRAAAIMVCLFVAFATSDLLPLAMVGFSLAVAVTLDATVVRLALAPALLAIAGRWNWWPRR